MRQAAWVTLGAAAGMALFVGLSPVGRASAQEAVTAAPAATPEAAPASEFVGSETCLTCHEEVGNQFKHTPHAASAQGCEGCHGPGKAHSESGEAASIRSFKTMSALE